MQTKRARIDWQWPAALVYSATFLTLGVLVFQDKLHPEVLLGMLTWLAPSPWLPKPPPPPPSQRTFDA